MVSENIETRILWLGLDSQTRDEVRRIVEDAIAEAVAGQMSAVLALTIPADWPLDYQVQFWAKYPNKKAKARALKVLDKIAFSGKTNWRDLFSGLERYIFSRDVQRGYVKHPETWLNGECWKDQEQSTPHPVERPKSFIEVAEDLWNRSNGAGTDQGHRHGR